MTFLIKQLKGSKHTQNTHLGRVFCGALIVFSVVILGAYWGSRIDEMHSLEEATLQDMERRAAVLTEAVSEQTRGAIYNLDLSLLFLTYRYSDTESLAEQDVRSVRNSTPDGLIRQVVLIDRDGRARMAFPADGVGADLSDRAHFSVHTAGKQSGLFIGRPVENRFDNKWVIPLSRRLVDRNGDFAGVIAVMTNPEYFAAIHGRFASGRDDVISLLLQDGAFLSRSQNLTDHLGKEVRADRPFIGDSAPASGTYRSVSSHEPVDRVFAFKRLSEWPLVTAIGLGVNESLAPVRASNRRELRAAILVSALVGLLVIGICIVVMRLDRSLVLVRESDERRAMAFAGATELAWEWELASGKIRFFGDCRPFFGVNEDERSIRVDALKERIHPDDWTTVSREIAMFLKGTVGHLEHRYRFRFASGEYRWVLVRGQAVEPGRDGRVGRSLGILIDIDADRKAQIEAAQTKQAYQRLIESTSEGILVVDRQAVIQLFNPAAERLLGFSAIEVIGRNAHPMFDCAAEGVEGQVETDCPVLATLQDARPRRGVRTAYRHKDGHLIPVEVSVAPITLDGALDGVVALIVDVSRQLANEIELERLARTDGLTGLWNRRYFGELVQREIVRAQRDLVNRPLSFLMVDLDHFKHVNDQHGHAAGDAVLVALAAHFREQLRQIDIVGRLGGEEFGVCLPGISFDEARGVAERVRAGLEKLDVVVGNLHIQCTASIGVTVWDGREPFDAVLGRADTALYRAKDTGRNQVVCDDTRFLSDQTQAP